MPMVSCGCCTGFCTAKRATTSSRPRVFSCRFKSMSPTVEVMAGGLPPRAVIVVDEAGQVGARQLRQVIELARQQRARLILSGDTRQHGAVAASDALRAVEAYGGVRIAEIQHIRRQDPQL